MAAQKIPDSMQAAQVVEVHLLLRVHLQSCAELQNVLHRPRMKESPYSPIEFHPITSSNFRSSINRIKSTPSRCPPTSPQKISLSAWPSHLSVTRTSWSSTASWEPSSPAPARTKAPAPLSPSAHQSRISKSATA